MKSADLKPETELQPQQTRALEKMRAEPALLAYHGLGSGKTLTSIAAAEDLGTNRRVIVPAALRPNYEKQLNQFVDKPENYLIESYNSAIKHPKSDKHDFTIFDEAHRMGGLDSAMGKLPNQVGGKAMFLTATPVRNEPGELFPLVQRLAADRNPPKSRDEFDSKFVGERSVSPGFWGSLMGQKPRLEEYLKNEDELKRLLKGRVDYHPSSGEFPGVTHEQVEVDMSPEQVGSYKGLMGKDPRLAEKVRQNLPPTKQELQGLNGFMAGVRQVSNWPAAYNPQHTKSPKIERMVEELRKSMAKPGHKALVYSNFVDAGIKPLADRLQSENIPHAMFTGGLSDEDRQRIVDDYNSGKTRVILVSGAGSEGLDLKGTRLMQIMEPHWNKARVNQVIGRGVRHRSHAHLPEEDRSVHVQHFFVRPPATTMQNWGLAKRDTGADRYMYELAENKEKLVNKLMTLLQDIGSAPAPERQPELPPPAGSQKNLGTAPLQAA